MQCRQRMWKHVFYLLGVVTVFDVIFIVFNLVVEFTKLFLCFFFRGTNTRPSLPLKVSLRNYYQIHDLKYTKNRPLSEKDLTTENQPPAVVQKMDAKWEDRYSETGDLQHRGRSRHMEDPHEMDDPRYTRNQGQLDPPPRYHDIDIYQHHVEEKLYNLDDKIRSTLVELQDAKGDLQKMRASNKQLEKKVEEAEADTDTVQAKIDALKAKLAVSSENLNRCNEEKEKIRTSLNESQVLVARLEERLAASSSELDRMRDPANPESNKSIKKHVINDKKEIRKLKMDVENERNYLDADNGEARQKEEEVKATEKELEAVNEELKACEQQRNDTQNEEENERGLKEEIIVKYRELKHERTTYEQRLKEARVQLGVKKAGKNVNVKLSDEMKSTEKGLNKQLATIEKRLKDALGDLDILRNRHRMSKTAMSINNYTRRTQTKRTGSIKMSLADSGTGNVKFTTKKDKSRGILNTGETVNMETAKGLEKSRGARGSQNGNSGSLTDRSNDTNLSKRDNIFRSREKVGKGDKRGSVQIVPHPKAKLSNTPRQ